MMSPCRRFLIPNKSFLLHKQTSPRSGSPCPAGAPHLGGLTGGCRTMGGGAGPAPHRSPPSGGGRTEAGTGRDGGTGRGRPARSGEPMAAVGAGGAARGRAGRERDCAGLRERARAGAESGADGTRSLAGGSGRARCPRRACRVWTRAR